MSTNTKTKKNNSRLKNSNIVLSENKIKSIYDIFIKEYSENLSEYIPYFNEEILRRITNFNDLIKEIYDTYKDDSSFRELIAHFLRRKTVTPKLYQDAITNAVINIINKNNELNCEIRKKIYLSTITDLLDGRYSNVGHILDINNDPKLTELVDNFNTQVYNEHLDVYNSTPLEYIMDNSDKNHNINKFFILCKELLNKLNMVNKPYDIIVKKDDDKIKKISSFLYQQINQIKLKKIINDSLINTNINTNNINIWSSNSHGGLTSNISNIGVKKNPSNTIIIMATPINRFGYKEDNIWGHLFNNKLKDIITNYLSNPTANIYCIIKEILNYTFLVDPTIILPNQTYFDILLTIDTNDSINNLTNTSGLIRFTKEFTSKTFYTISQYYQLSSIVEQISNENKDIYNIIIVNCCRSCNNDLEKYITEKIYITENALNILNNIIINKYCDSIHSELFKISLTTKNNTKNSNTKINKTLFLNKSQTPVKHIAHKYQIFLRDHKYKELYNLIKNKKTNNILYTNLYDLYIFCYQFYKNYKKIHLGIFGKEIMNRFINFILLFREHIEDEDIHKIVLLLLQSNHIPDNIFLYISEENILLLIQIIIPILKSLEITYLIYCKLDLYYNSGLFKEKNNYILIPLYNVIFQNIKRDKTLISNNLVQIQLELFKLFTLIINKKNIELVNLFLNFKLLIPLNDNSNTLLDVLGKIYNDFDITNLDKKIYDEYDSDFYYEIKDIVEAFTTIFPDWQTSDTYKNWKKT